MSINATPNSTRIPILLLKTRSEPHDAYEEYFSRSTHPPTFNPTFIPVLEHQHNDTALSDLSQLLINGRMKEHYGGMIFTSQRAVEAWATTVHNLKSQTSPIASSDLNLATDIRTSAAFHTDVFLTTPFPLYVVGPATSSLLSTLLSSPSAFSALNPTIHGADTGSGAALAPFILTHYNDIHSQRWFTYHDAPRLPFIPLVGMGSENYSRKRLEADDWRLVKRPLLFLVGEQRRDVIPRMLMAERLGMGRVEVVEKEVYKTVVRDGFGLDLRRVAQGLQCERVVVVVVFSPQGAGDMLRVLGLVDEDGKRVESRGPRYVVVTIGPTTRDYLKDTFGFEPDVCAKKPSPEGVDDGVRQFLQENGLAEVNG